MTLNTKQKNDLLKLLQDPNLEFKILPDKDRVAKKIFLNADGKKVATPTLEDAVEMVSHLIRYKRKENNNPQELKEIKEKIDKLPASVNGTRLILTDIITAIEEVKPLSEKQLAELLQKKEAKISPENGMIKLSIGGNEIGRYTTHQAKNILPLLPTKKDGKEHPKAVALKGAIMFISKKEIEAGQEAISPKGMEF